MCFIFLTHSDHVILTSGLEELDGEGDKGDGLKVIGFEAIDLLQAGVAIDPLRLHRGAAPGAWQD
jgi:hypothetical protein